MYYFNRKNFIIGMKKFIISEDSLKDEFDKIYHYSKHILGLMVDKTYKKELLPIKNNFNNIKGQVGIRVDPILFENNEVSSEFIKLDKDFISVPVMFHKDDIVFYDGNNIFVSSLIIPNLDIYLKILKDMEQEKIKIDQFSINDYNEAYFKLVGIRKI